MFPTASRNPSWRIVNLGASLECRVVNAQTKIRKFARFVVKKNLRRFSKKRQKKDRTAFTGNPLPIDTVRINCLTNEMKGCYRLVHQNNSGFYLGSNYLSNKNRLQSKYEQNQAINAHSNGKITSPQTDLMLSFRYQNRWSGLSLRRLASDPGRQWRLVESLVRRQSSGLGIRWY